MSQITSPKPGLRPPSFDEKYCNMSKPPSERATDRRLWILANRSDSLGRVIAWVILIYGLGVISGILLEKWLGT